jgi:hypothetical protein
MTIKFDIYKLPEGESDSDQRWQDGYHDGCNEICPSNGDPVYVSGWCHGYAGGNQCSVREAVLNYWKLIYDNNLPTV